jgi:hypothetical protein
MEGLSGFAASKRTLLFEPHLNNDPGNAGFVSFFV